MVRGNHRHDHQSRLPPTISIYCTNPSIRSHLPTTSYSTPRRHPSKETTTYPMKLGTPPSRRIIGALLLGAALRTRSSDAFVVGDRPILATAAASAAPSASAASASASASAGTTPTSLGMVRNRGLERRVEGATPMREFRSRARFFCLVALLPPPRARVTPSLPYPARRFDFAILDIIIRLTTKSLPRPATPPPKKKISSEKTKNKRTTAHNNIILLLLQRVG